MARHIDKEAVIADRDLLPAFPQTISMLLKTLDDPEANFNQLSQHIELDPILTARVLARANVASLGKHFNSRNPNVYTAASLIGLSALRETVILTSLGGFFSEQLCQAFSPKFWEHSASVSVSSQQLALHSGLSGDAALIAGLMHDIGQLWLFRKDPDTWTAAMETCLRNDIAIQDAERQYFGVDHAQVGGWLGESWKLPRAICDAIRYHHNPDLVPENPLASVTHIAEVLSIALGHGARNDRVSYLSATACKTLHLAWDESAHSLFGHIDGASHYVATFFHPNRRTEIPDDKANLLGRGM